MPYSWFYIANYDENYDKGVDYVEQFLNSKKFKKSLGSHVYVETREGRMVFFSRQADLLTGQHPLIPLRNDVIIICHDHVFILLQRNRIQSVESGHLVNDEENVGDQKTPISEYLKRKKVDLNMFRESVEVLLPKHLY